MITDLTSTFTDLNREDKVYRSASGYIVKIKVRSPETLDPARLNFVVTGSLCGDDAKAEPFGAGHFIIAPMEFAPHSESAVDLERDLETVRQTVVAQVELAAINRDIRQGLSGVAVS